MRLHLHWICILTLFLLKPLPAQEAEWIRILRSVGPEGAGNTEAAAALSRLVAGAGVELLPRLLEAMEENKPLAANWLRAGFETIAEKAARQGAGKVDGGLPAAKLEAFALDRARPPLARRLAYEWLLRADPKAEARLIPRMLDDPAVELRRDAVASLLTRAGEHEKAGQSGPLREVLRQALSAARDIDQLDIALKKLRALGETVDVPALFGFLREWVVIGPFDNRRNAGFETAYGPEKELRFDAEQEGKSGPVRWKAQTTDDEFGVVDLNKSLGMEKGVAAYAYTEFESDADRDVELRAATVNAWKVWVNGAPAFTRNEYHHGTQLDHYQARARLRRGKNQILLKVCQNEQTEDYAKTWEFQIRVCDATGAAILPASRPSLPVRPEENPRNKSADGKAGL